MRKREYRTERGGGGALEATMRVGSSVSAAADGALCSTTNTSTGELKAQSCGSLARSSVCVSAWKCTRHRSSAGAAFICSSHAICGSGIWPCRQPYPAIATCANAIAGKVQNPDLASPALGSGSEIWPRFWRREPESNRRRRICNPLHDHSAITTFCHQLSQKVPSRSVRRDL